MDELRPRVREAFGEQQAELGNIAGARERLMRAALAERDAHRSGRMQFAAGIAAILIAALVIGTFLYLRAGTIWRHPVPAATPSPLSRPLNVSNDTPVILYRDPADASQMDGVTWDGKTSGRVDWPAASGAANPSANLFATGAEIRDRSGALVASGMFGGKYFIGKWADDGRHICQLVPFDSPSLNGVPATLQLVMPGSPARDVAQVGKIFQQGGTTVDACSVRKDRAVVSQRFGIAPVSPIVAQYWVVQLSTGKILWTHAFAPDANTTIAVSPEADYIAENTGFSAPVQSTIYGADGSVQGHLAARVYAFCWDGSLAVTDPGYGSGPVSEISWQTGRVVWSGPKGYLLNGAQAQPDGSTLAIWLVESTVQLGAISGVIHADIYIVASQGGVLAVIRREPM